MRADSFGQNDRNAIPWRQSCRLCDKPVPGCKRKQLYELQSMYRFTNEHFHPELQTVISPTGNLTN